MDITSTAEILGGFGEFVGALAVLVSLLYIARQSKVANDLNRTRTFREIMYAMTTHLNLMFGPENVTLAMKGLLSYETLPTEERVRFEHLLAGIFQFVEDSWQCAEAGIINEELIQNWEWFLREKLFPYPGVREWWSDYREAYGAVPRKWVDSILQSAAESSDPYSIKHRD